ncbi:hypothetical protein WICMUC_005499 [Wickerhamomyces mucosus]|uniref:C2 NT-type domain-containing protein n=1 Tax=Wickerhamomyces mucosus TaxID=1378264 RepID=A0A9P8P7E5_9ASCO|nr:hypothetical protein WICMUC_005499 [Wickerhamomyces mucosus]
MIPLPSKRSPRFLLELSIEELTNIPKLSGSCYIKWNIRDSQVKGKTPRKHIKDYKAVWNYESSHDIRLTIGKDKILNNKIIQFRIYTENHLHSNHSGPFEITHGDSNNINRNGNTNGKHKRSSSDTIKHNPSHLPVGKNLIGKLEIDLSEFTVFQESVSRRYLLKESKINCILNLKINMELIQGERSSFIPPPIKYKGLSGVFSNDSSHGYSASISGSGSGSNSVLAYPHSNYSSNVKDTSNTSSSEKFFRASAINNDPVISKLYQQLFEVSWDIRPGEFNAYESVEDINNGGDGWARNEEGERLIDLQKNNTNNNNEQTINVDHENRAAYRGTTKPSYITKPSLRESEIRGDLKSWSVSKSMCHIEPTQSMA